MNIRETQKIDNLTSSALGSLMLSGYIGDKIQSCINNGVMAADHKLYCVPFMDKTDDGGSWGGEFWGKWFTSAALAYRYQPTLKHRQKLDQAVKDLLTAQDLDGRLSSCERDFGDWDIWGRKYALLGLIAYYDQTGEIYALEAAKRVADKIIEIAGPGQQKLTETGLDLIGALSSNSILEPVVLLYQRTKMNSYLEFSEYLVSLWSETNDYSPKGMRLIEDGLAGVAPVSISEPKAYEMMSCYEGLCELYRATGNKQYLNAVIQFAESVREKEIMIVGSGSSGELWCDGANRQTEMLEQPMETCVSVTWMKLCYQLLRLTGDPTWADEMEVSLYNALLSSMMPKGDWWAYFSPLTGERVPSSLQVPLVGSSCCVVNGPRGLLTVPGWSVMTDDKGPVINLFNDGEWTCKLNDGFEVKIQQQTKYPVEEQVEITIQQTKSADYSLKIRIPSWSQNSELSVNGKNIPCIAGTYVEINRTWNNGDCILLKVDLRGRVITSPGSVNHQAVMRGPIVLALDSRTVKPEPVNVWLHHDQMKWQHNDAWNIDYVLIKEAKQSRTEERIELIPCSSKPEDMWMAFEVPFLIRPTHFIKHSVKKLVMCDYASAGNTFSPQSVFRVWLPQPLFLGSVFPDESWKVLTSAEERPGVPEITQNQSASGSLSLKMDQI